MASVTWPEYKPGSDGAIQNGCTCPVLDNGHGRGYMGDGERFGFVITENCPLHGALVATPSEAYGPGEKP